LPVSNTLGAIPVVARTNPPEGRQSAAFAITLTPLVPNFVTSWQLKSPGGGGLNLSQVLSIYVDNISNPYAIVMTHGVMNEVTFIGANTSAIVPTLSNNASFTANFATAPGVNPTSNMVFNIVLMNYYRPPGSRPNVLGQPIAGMQQNVTPLYSGYINYTYITNVFPLVAGFNNVVLSEFELAVEGSLFAGPAAQDVVDAASWQLFSFVLGFFDTLVCLAAGNVKYYAPASDVWVAGRSIAQPARISWPQGLVCLAGSQVYLQFAAGADFDVVDNVFFRANLSGIAF
jgi:hypothetical protein